jgi:hypothetical protein
MAWHKPGDHPGIEVDGVRVKTTALLSDGALITIGTHRFSFEISGERVSG